MIKNEIEKPDDFLKLIAKKDGDFLYQDHPNDGIDLFSDEILEEMGWQSSTFDFITYRDIATFIEDNCEGTLTFNDHPMGFNGFAEVDDIEDVRVKVKQFIVEQIKNNPIEDYDDDQKEALNFFGVN